MINIKPDWKSSLEDVFTIIRSKNNPDKQTLLEIENLLKTRMMRYIIYRKNLQCLERYFFKSCQVNALKNCYDNDTNALKALKVKLVSNIKNQNEFLLKRCPYCLAREPNTWDHYMPKSNFPEYSVFSANLIWVCEQCNKKKSDKLVEGTKQAIHTYFDTIPNKNLLKCLVTVVNRTPIPYFYISNFERSPAVESLIKHFEAFNLAELYRSEASTSISLILQELANNFPNGITQEAMDDALGSKFSAIPISWGDNYWEAALLEGMRGCRDLVGVALFPNSISVKNTPNMTNC
ncbi:HNH endonuclease [Vibrio metoecus]|uniref:HNH endonuclease n=1 Tax=Vibrio metoecus TaxID=1481663 RepID=UPI00069F73F5|nr:HNH endonuclease [Vibrio metoecus]